MFNRLYAELDTDLIKYVYAKAGVKKASIKKWGCRPMPAGTFVNGRVEDKEALIRLLSEIKKELGIRRCSVNLSIKDESIITRPLELPILSERDIEKHLFLEAEQYLPINRNNYQVSFKIIKKETAGGGIGSSLMVAAIPTESVNRILECFDRCNLHPKVLDAYPNNICRILNELQEDNIAVIDFGKKGINITITENRSFYMHSYMQINMESVLESYRKDYSITADEFYKIFYYKEFDYEIINNDSEASEEGLEAVLSGVLGQISRYLDYFNSRHFGRTVDRIYVIGEYGMLIGLKKIMSYTLRSDITIGMRPFKNIKNENKNSFEAANMSYYSLMGMIMRGSRL